MASYTNYQVDRNKSFKGINLFKKGSNFNRVNDNLTKSEKLMNGIAFYAGYYRSNPQRFVKEYLFINLKVFQQILLYFMMHFHYFIYLAARGQGKTFLTAIYCVTRAILFPGTKIMVSSGQKSQSKEIIDKIEELRKDSPNLAREIEDIKTGTNDPRVDFHNGSWIRTTASTQGARGARANLLIVDEFRMVDLDIINKVLRKFLTAPRQPKYLEKPEYKHLKERNKEIYLSSAWYKSHWSWKKVLAYFKSMLDGKNYFVCGLPYYLSIKEGLLMEEQVIDEMSESDFDEVAWSIEMECLFFGESEKAYFKFDDMDKNRKIIKALYPKDYYNLLKDKKFKYEHKENNEIRLLSCDIAGMSGSQNDASAYMIIRLIPKSNGYERQIVYLETLVGGHTVIQATRIRQLFEDFDCDYIVLDTQNMGLGVYDQLCIDLYDKERGKEYKAISCINDEKMAERCLSQNSPKIIYSIKGSQSLNSEVAIILKDTLKRGKIKTLVNENDGRDYLKSLKDYYNLSAENKAKLEAVYLQITYLINEMINLSNEGKDGLVKLVEPKNGRKDRVSALLYGNYIASLLEKDLLKNDDSDPSDPLVYF